MSSHGGAAQATIGRDDAAAQQDDDGGPTRATGGGEPRGRADDRATAATATATATAGTAAQQQETRGRTTRKRSRPRPDELYVDWDTITNRNESGWPGEHSLISHISFPEMDALLGWATHQETGPRGGHSRPPTRPSVAARRPRRMASASAAPHVQGEAIGERDNQERARREAEQEGAPPPPPPPPPHSRILLPSSSVVMSPPSLLELLEEKSRSALDSELHKQIWDPRAWRRRTADEGNGTPTPRVTTAEDDPAAVPTHVSAPVALACFLEEAVVDALLPVAEAYVEHCRRAPARRGSQWPAAAAAADGKGVDEKSGPARRGGARMELEDSDGSEAVEDDDDKDDDTKNSAISESDVHDGENIDVEAWTASPDEALCALLMDHGVGHGDPNDAEWAERRKRVVAYLARWKGTDVLVQSLRI